ncbi:hypothetical protein MTR_1g015120 [Medicago truncatula]|uniref:C2 NT-type domain-containing protein n=1 Tax=Medicago truncatula TaxID=3880 RepID=G7I8Z4_MEDTR|nr:hypothetical protein MTR_1g015120 [Medicago truncatula]
MMMKPNFESQNKDVGETETDSNIGHEELLRDIEELSKALYLDNTPFKPSTLSAEKSRSSKSQLNSTPRFVSEDLLIGDKKLSSKWNWKKPLKVLTNIGSQKLSVHWKRKNSILQTCPSRVLDGSAEFDETLVHRCSVYGGRVVSGRSVKYESKRFLIYASVVGEPEHDIGKHQVDLTRLLPRSLEELRGDKSSGKWSTSFRLVGKALGARLNVSFGYQVMKDDLMRFGASTGNVVNLVNLKTNTSIPDNVAGFSSNNRDVIKLRPTQNDVVLSNEAVMNSGSGFSKSITFLYQKLDEENFNNSACADSESSQGSNLNVSDDTEFSISEQGVETSEEDSFEFDQTRIQIVDMSTVEIIDVDEIIKDDDTFVDNNASCDSLDTICSRNVNWDIADNSKHRFSISCVDLLSMKIKDSVSETSKFLDKEEHYFSVKSNDKAHKKSHSLDDVIDSVASDLPSMKIKDSVSETSEFLDKEEHYLSAKSNDKAHKRSHSLDDVIDSVASDFLKTLALESGSFRSSCDGDPMSPREKLLRQFENEALASGNFAFDFNANEEELGQYTLEHNYEDYDVDSDLSLIIGAAEEEYEREDQSLMQRRKAKILEDLETDTLMQQWGLDERDFENSPRTWSGGFGSPIEISDEEPSILPSIGEGLGSFFQTRSGGFLRSMCPSLFRNAKNCGSLIIQASNPVVLPAKIGNDILDILLYMASARVEELCNYISKSMPLQDITGKSIKHIVSDAKTNTEASGRKGSWQHNLFEEFPCSYLTDKDKCLDSLSLETIAPMTINKIESLLIEGLRIQSSLSNEDAPSCIRGEINNDLDGLMDLSVTLDQWLRLDSGIIQGEHNLEQILKILKAHNSKITELYNEGLGNGIDKEKIDGRKRCYLGEHATMAFMIQHRDPLRNYEAVGVPMLVLTQAERVDIHEMEKDCDNFVENEDIDKEPPQSRFKIKEIHIAGVLTKNGGNRQVWGTASQQQSGLRWLLSSGMCNTVKHSSSKSKSIVVRSSSLFANKLMNQDILWSISCVNSNIETNAHIRNPDIMFPK